MRCDHCELRYTFQCHDGFDRKPNDVLCEDFILEFGTLDDDEREEIQRKLMGEDKYE